MPILGVKRDPICLHSPLFFCMYSLIMIYAEFSDDLFCWHARSVLVAAARR